MIKPSDALWIGSAIMIALLLIAAVGVIVRKPVKPETDEDEYGA